MQKTQVYLPSEELEALRQAARRSGRSVAAIIRDAIRQVVLRPAAPGEPGDALVAIWDGEPRRNSIDHDSIYDEA
jgi:hypothetical protein